MTTMTETKTNHDVEKRKHLRESYLASLTETERNFVQWMATARELAPEGHGEPPDLSQTRLAMDLLCYYEDEHHPLVWDNVWEYAGAFLQADCQPDDVVEWMALGLPAQDALSAHEKGMSPEDVMQTLESRNHTVDDVCMWRHVCDEDLGYRWDHWSPEAEALLEATRATIPQRG